MAPLPFRSVTSSYGQLGSKAVAACSAIVPGAPNQRADLPYFKPHSFRMTLAMLAERICPTSEAFKAWSQNLGHEQVLTTFSSYGEVSSHRQAELIKGLATQPAPPAQLEFLVEQLSQLARRGIGRPSEA